MKLKLFGREIRIGRDLSQYIGRSDDFFSVIQQKYGSDYQVRNYLNAYKNVVYACVTLIGEACGDYQPYVERRNGDQQEKVNHEFIDLIARPSGRDLKADSFSQFDLFEATVSYMLLQGECFWYMALGTTTGRPREIVVLRPDRVGTDINKTTGEIDGYFIRQASGQPPIPLEVNEVLRFNLFNPRDPYKGKSVVQAGSDYIATDESTAEYTKNFFQNNAGLSGVLNIKGEVTKGAFRKFVRAWREKYEGVGNAGKVAVLRDSDAAFTKVGLGLDELNMAELRKMSLADVAMMFKVPLELLGKITEGAGLGRGNIETLEYVFAKWNIDKKLQRFDSVLQFALERYYPQDASLTVCHENIIPEDKEFELNERNLLTDKVYTRNEVRDEEGLDPVDGGDQLFVPLNFVPIGEASLEPASTSSSQSGLKVKVTRKIIRKATEAVRKATSQGERFRLTVMRNQARYEKQYKKTIKPIFLKQRQEALKNLEAHASTLNKAAEQKLFDDAYYDNLITDSLQPTLVDLAETQGGLALIFAGDTQNEFHMTSNIQSALKDGTRKMASNFNDETLERLNNTLAEGIAGGEGIGDLKRRVNTVYDNIDSKRAERIARTETLKASNAATRFAYQQTGYVTGMQWAVNPTACPQCLEFEGKTVPLDSSFLGLGESYSYTDESGEEQTATNDYDTVETPPLHPNCMCTIIPTTGDLSSPNLLTDDAEEGQAVYRGEGQNASSSAGLMFGDAYYIARDAGTASNFGTVHALRLPITMKDIYVIRTDKQLDSFQLAAQKFAVEEGADLDPAKYIPAYILHLGYKAAEVLPKVDPLGGIGVVDKKTIKALAAQMEAESKALEGMVAKEEHDKVLKQSAQDKIYIKELETHLGVNDDEPASQDSTAKKG